MWERGCNSLGRRGVSSDQRPLERDVKTVPELKLVSQLSPDKIKLTFSGKAAFFQNISDVWK